MGLTRNMVRRHEIPHEPGQWVELRPLSAEARERARWNETLAAVQRVRELGELPSATPRPEPPTPNGSGAHVVVADPLAGWHKPTILKHAVVAWSYDAPVNDEALADLDETTRDWLVATILGLETQAERLFGSAPSTAT